MRDTSQSINTELRNTYRASLSPCLSVSLSLSLSLALSLSYTHIHTCWSKPMKCRACLVRSNELASSMFPATWHTCVRAGVRACG